MTQKKVDFEQFKEAQRNHWEKELAAIKSAHKEETEQQQKKWQRGKEEYEYHTKRERAQDQDAYQIKKAAQEKELADKRSALDAEFLARETALSTGEQELNGLRDQVDGFAAQLQQAVQEAEQHKVQQLTQQHQYEKDLLMKEIEGKQRLSEQTIISLQQKIEEQVTLIKQLTERSTHATSQVQDIAVKAIEGASAKPVYLSVDDNRQTVTSINQHG